MSDVETQKEKESGIEGMNELNDDIVQQLFNDDDDAFMDLAY